VCVSSSTVCACKACPLNAFCNNTYIDHTYEMKHALAKAIQDGDTTKLFEVLL